MADWGNVEIVFFALAMFILGMTVGVALVYYLERKYHD